MKTVFSSSNPTDVATPATTTTAPEMKTVYSAPFKKPVRATIDFQVKGDPRQVAPTPIRTVYPTGTPPPAETLPPWEKYKGKVSNEDIEKDPALMAVVDNSLEAMFGSSDTSLGKAAMMAKDITVGFSGGATSGGWKDKSKKERIDIWENFNRSFAGGQSITTLDVATHIGLASEKNRAALGAGFLLFDQKANIFSENSTWGNMFDGMADYATAAVWDPVTLASFGVGKAIGATGIRASALALKAVGIAAFKQSLKTGVTREVAAVAATKAYRQAYTAIVTKNVVKNSAFDMAANVGLNISYQNSLIDVGAQDKFSYLQTGVVALGGLILPSLIASIKGLTTLKRSMNKSPVKDKLFSAYIDVEKKFSLLINRPDLMDNVMKARMNLPNVNGAIATTFQKFNADIANFVPWSKAKVEAGQVLNKDGIKLTTGESQSLFWRSFLFGDVKGNNPGFFKTISDEGYVYVPRARDDTATNSLGDVMSWLDDAVVKDAVTNFEKTVGKAFEGTVETAKQLSAAWKKRESEAGMNLYDASRARSLASKVGITPEDLDPTGAPSDQQLGKYLLSIWKRLTVSHPATTLTNIKGWAALSALNATSDVVLGVLKLAEAGVWKVAGKTDAYTAAMNASKGSIIGSIKRGYNVFNFNDTIDAAASYLSIKPEMSDRILRQNVGGVEKSGVVEAFNIKPTGTVKVAEGAISFVQTLYGVTLQDEVTKLFSFHSALEQGILREYGQSFNKFMSRPDAYVEMFTPRFKENVDAWAMNRTLRETVSKSWSQKQNGGLFTYMAKGVESWSRNKYGGYLLPFGSFMNTSLAVLGDYAGVNAIKHLTARAINPVLKAVGSAGYKFDKAEEEGMDLLAKGIVGWTAMLTYYVPQAVEKITKGYTWNQSERDDGSLTDNSFDFPLSYLQIVAQLVAHYQLDGEVPEALAVEAGQVLLSQPFRQLDDSVKKAFSVFESVLKGDVDQAYKDSISVASSTLSRIFSGPTRPLDPVNQAAIYMSDDPTTIDRKQASNVFFAQSLKYVDQIFGGFEGPRIATSTRGYEAPPQDLGKTLGVKTSPPPNLPERMLASVGRKPWDAILWNGDAEVKNYMDGIVGPILNSEAVRMLEAYPDFFDLPLSSREAKIDVMTKLAKDRAEQVLEFTYSELGDVIKLKKDLAKIDKKDVSRTKAYLGITGDPLDLVKEEGGLEKLKTLIFMSEHFDEFLVK